MEKNSHVHTITNPINLNVWFCCIVYKLLNPYFWLKFLQMLLFRQICHLGNDQTRNNRFTAQWRNQYLYCFNIA